VRTDAIRGYYSVFIKFISHPGTLAFFKVFLGVIFLLSSVTKVFETAKFMDSIAGYKIVPQMFLYPMALIIPWVQLVCGLLLMLDVYPKSNAFVLSGLLTVYTIAITSAFIRGIDMDCGCFDLMIGLPDRVGIFAIVRDLVLLGMSGSVFLFDKNTPSFYGLTARFGKKSK
jgi:putative oxidoreductase